MKSYNSLIRTRQKGRQGCHERILHPYDGLERCPDELWPLARKDPEAYRKLQAEKQAREEGK